MRSVYTISGTSGSVPVLSQTHTHAASRVLSINNTSTNTNTDVAAISSTHYDKRGLLGRDTDAFALSLRSLAYLTHANTHLVAQLMLQDGGVGVLVHVLQQLLLGCDDSSSGPFIQPISPPMPFHSLDSDDRLSLATHAMSAAANLMLRGRSKVRDALVEAGLVNVLVRFLGPIVGAIEQLQLLPAPVVAESTVSVRAFESAPTIQDTANPSSNPISTSISSDSMEIDSATPNVLASLDSISSVSSSSTEPNTPATISSGDQQTPVAMDSLSSNIGLSLPHAPSAAEPVQPVALIQAVQPIQTQQQPQSRPTQQELPMLPGVRLPLASSPETTTLLSKIIPHQHHILLSAKILHVVSKYPHLRHYMHIDSTRPLRASVRDLCAAAIAAADGLGADKTEPISACLSKDLLAGESKSASTNGGIRLDGMDLDQQQQIRMRVILDRFEGNPSIPAVTANPAILADVFTAANSTSLFPAAVAPNATVSTTTSTIQPVVTTIPLLAFEHESEQELLLLEELCQIPNTLPSQPSTTAHQHQKTHLIQSALHFLPQPVNPRSAFDLLEVFTTPCALIPEARALAVATLRNAYRRDPVPTPSEPPHMPLNQAMGPCMYVDVDAFSRGGVVRGWKGGASAGRAVVVGLGHLRRCASSTCGKWENGYKQFSKCSRCRRVSYCSKNCQRRAWVLHKNWCLKYTGDTGIVSGAAVSSTASNPSAGPQNPINATALEEGAVGAGGIPASSAEEAASGIDAEL
ncbi:hypothetical protein CcCBS67573_g03326 [Chytriomyces confervae]|uniref:MYND-type domain-containing protein n=1 Tax=Chytriomyces confervae TaxID=246404 RepID=A0A507FJ61_9FUNG|nr:hypothetical protein HDU80_005168 [Chytriomyces hyalinus]TPX75418.1 hypothetical protein CcCBS67573_g03326 [Chytriomyces confervae]